MSLFQIALLYWLMEANSLADVLADRVNQNVPLLFVFVEILVVVVGTGMALNRAYRDFLSPRWVTMRGRPSVVSATAVAKTVK